MYEFIKKGYKQIPAYLYLFVMCSVFLFYWDDYYFNITETRYKFFRIATITLIVLYVVIGLVSIVLKLKEKENIGLWFKVCIKKVYGTLNLADMALLLFLVVSYVSLFLSSEYHYQIWHGNVARYMGVEFYTLITIAYFLISRNIYKVKPVILCFGFAVSLVSILTILNFFNIDPFGFYINLKHSSAIIFLSTIGNINFLSSLLCLAYPITAFLYITCTNKSERIFYLICSVLSFIGIVLASSDSGFLGCGFALFLILVIVCKNMQRLLSFFLLLLASLAGGKAIVMLVTMFPNDVHTLDTISRLVCDGVTSWALLIIVIVILMLLTSFKDVIAPKLSKLPLRKLLISAFFLVIVFVIGVIVYFTCVDTERDLGSMANYLRFDSHWGTSRGYVWPLSFDVYSKFSFAQKLVGFGPGTFFYAAGAFVFDLTNNYDNAHCEYIQYLITVGIAGLGMYLVFLFAMVKDSIQKLYRNHVYLLALTLSFVTYIVQATVNLNQILTTPIFFLIAAMMRGILIHMDEKKEQYLETEKAAVIEEANDNPIGNKDGKVSVVSDENDKNTKETDSTTIINNQEDQKQKAEEPITNTEISNQKNASEEITAKSSEGEKPDSNDEASVEIKDTIAENAASTSNCEIEQNKISESNINLKSE